MVYMEKVLYMGAEVHAESCRPASVVKGCLHTYVFPVVAEEAVFACRDRAVSMVVVLAAPCMLNFSAVVLNWLHRMIVTV